MNLYELSKEYEVLESKLEEWAIRNNGDVSDFPFNQELEDIEEASNIKALNIACYVKNLAAEVEAYKQEKQKIERKQKLAKHKLERIKQYLSSNIKSGEKIKDSRVSISWRKSQSVDLDIAPEKLPVQFQRVSVEANLSDIKTILKGGGEVSGCHLTKKYNIQIL